MIDAEKACMSVGGNLASIQNYGELSFIRRLIYRTLRSYRPAWIGLHDAVQERQFMWTDGSRVRYTCWDRGEPNNLYRREHCTEVYRSGIYWRDRPCYYYRPYICARDR
ncbi:galactose-specific lectin nattectin-like [Sphaeramia orbicularis]|uniref:Galactose-specific lectin nattectin-like n=1 Tax=Sphaeramia orbicularis TaxID=375764 RepID=A0A672YGD4_9TELE|nr:galactose-specific lectin nattectin-like [Sphaeramia orbicularis]